MTRAVGSLREVELVEEGVEAPVAQGRRRWWWVVGALVVVVALLVGGQAALDARRQRHEARFDDVAGVLRPLPSVATMLWSYDAYGPAAQSGQAAQVGSRVIAGSVSTTDRTYTIRQIDRATGGTVWSTTSPVDPGIELPEGSTVACRALDQGVSTLAACAVGPFGNGWPAEPARQQIAVVDARDGSVAGGMTGNWMNWAAGDGLLVTGSSVTTGSTIAWTLVASDLHGARVWTATLPDVDVRTDPEPDADGFISASQSYDTGLTASGSRVVLAEHGRVWVLDDGEVTASFDEGRGYGTLIVRGGHVVVQDPSSEKSRLLLPDGSLRAVSGSPEYLSVDDGSASDVILMRRSDKVVAVDARTGATRAALLAGASSTLVLGGRALTAAGSVVVAVDLRTGDRVWLARPSEAVSTLYTDGRAIYATEQDEQTHLLAFDIDDGTPLGTRVVQAAVDLHPDDGEVFTLFQDLGMLQMQPGDTLQVFG